MINSQKFKGAFLVSLGAISYGILATIVKYANQLGIHTSVLTFMQFSVGVIFLIVYSRINQNKNNNTAPPSRKSKIKLILFGTSLGLTSSLYYLSIQYIPVSMGIILLMQSIWMSVILEIIVLKQKPSLVKLIGTLLVIGGTLLATNILFETASINWIGIFWGLGAGFCYTISLFSSSNIETSLPSFVRSKYLVIGGLIAIILFWNTSIIHNMHSLSVLKWGILLAVFGTILPPLLFTKGIPMTGIGLGSIIAAIEIPVSIISAFLILHEHISAYQWLGVGIIVSSVIIVNIKMPHNAT
jgi:drug/metabolite transporter (DMT)-like permease